MGAAFPLPWRAEILRSRWSSPYEKGIAIRAANGNPVASWWDDERVVPSEAQVECVVNCVNRFAPGGPHPDPWLVSFERSAT
ncbi:MAG: hypothetical protein WCA81_05710 [Rhizomicrobium sp.]